MIETKVNAIKLDALPTSSDYIPQSYTIIGYVLMSFYLLLCCLYYQERIIYLDSSLFPIYLFNNGSVPVFESRYSCFCVDIIPYIFKQMGGNLNTIVFVYSLTYAFLHLVVYILITHVFKKPITALYVPFLLLVHEKVLFFWPENGSTMAVTFGAIIFLILYKEKGVKTSFSRLSILIVFSLFILFFHPLSIFVIFFTLCYNAAQDRKIRLEHLIGIAIIMMFSIFKFLTMSAYETNAISKLSNLSLTVFSSSYVKAAINYYLKNFPVIGIILILQSIYLLRTKKYAVLSIIYMNLILFLLILNIAMPVTRHSELYFHHINLPIAFFITFPFFFDVLPGFFKMKEKWHHVTFLFFFFLAVIFTVPRLSNIGNKITERHELERKLCQSAANMGVGLVYLEPANLDPLLRNFRYFLMSESMLLSALDHPDFQTIIVARDIGKRHFKDIDASSYFKALNRQEVLGNTPGIPDIFVPDYLHNLAIQVQAPNIVYKNITFRPHIILINKNAEKIPSGFSDNYHIYISYYWMRGDEKVRVKEIRTPIGIDVRFTHSQRITVLAPSQPGKFNLIIALYLKEKGWLDCKEIVPIIVK